jgi:hypothetical protein
LIYSNGRSAEEPLDLESLRTGAGKIKGSKVKRVEIEVTAVG